MVRQGSKWIDNEEVYEFVHDKKSPRVWRWDKGRGKYHYSHSYAKSILQWGVVLSISRESLIVVFVLIHATWGFFMWIAMVVRKFRASKVRPVWDLTSSPPRYLAIFNEQWSIRYFHQFNHSLLRLKNVFTLDRGYSNKSGVMDLFSSRNTVGPPFIRLPVKDYIECARKFYS